MVIHYRFDLVQNETAPRLGVSSQKDSTLRVSTPASGLSIEVEDNGDGLLDTRDRYSLAYENKLHSIRADEGLRLLNYFLNPRVLEGQQRKIGFSKSEHLSEEREPPISLQEISAFTPQQLEEIQSTPSAWFMDGHLDISLLEGARVFLPSENEAWASHRPTEFSWAGFASMNSSAGGYHVSNGHFVREQIVEKSLVAFAFMGLSASTSPHLTWHLFTGNYTSHELGSIALNTRVEEKIAKLSNTSENPQENLNANLAVVEERLHRSERDLYFGFTRPVIAVACLADADFRRWVAQLFTPSLQEYSMLRFYGTMFAEAGKSVFTSLAAGAVIAGFSSFSIYELSRIWYDAYGHLDYPSTENKIASALSTALSEAWLLSRVGRQVQAITGNSGLTWSNLAAARVPLAQANFQFVDLARDFTRSFPVLNWVARQFVAPSLGEIARNLNTACSNFKAAALRRENIELILKGVGARTVFQQTFYRFSPRLLPYYLRVESFFAGRAFSVAQRGLLAAIEKAETASLAGRLGSAVQAVKNAANMARALVAVGGVAKTAMAAVVTTVETAATAIASAAGIKIGLFVALGFSVGAGIGTGIAYAVGTYDENFTPQDAVKKFIPALRLFWG